MTSHHFVSGASNRITLISLLDRHILAETSSILLIGLLLTTGIFFGAVEFKTLFALIADSGIPINTAVQVSLLSMPSLLIYTMPAGVLMAAALVLHRQNMDSESLIIRISGADPFRRLRPICAMAILCALACFIVNDYVAPASGRLVHNLLLSALHRCEMPAVFNLVGEFDTKRCVVVGARLKKSLKNVILFDLADPEKIVLTLSDTVHWRNGRWSMEDGSSYHLYTMSNQTRILHFSSMIIEGVVSKLTAKQDSGALPVRKSTAELKTEICSYGGKPVPPELFYKYYRCFSQPLACVLALLSLVPFAFPGRRSRSTVPFIVGGLFICAYFILEQSFFALGQIGRLDPLIAAWAPTVICLLLTLVCIVIVRVRRL